MEEILSILCKEFRKIIHEEIKESLKDGYLNDDKWIDTNELCNYLGVSRSWVSHRMNQIPHIKEPLRFRKSEVDKWLMLQSENKSENIHICRDKKKKYKVV